MTRKRLLVQARKPLEGNSMMRSSWKALAAGAAATIGLGVGLAASGAVLPAHAAPAASPARPAVACSKAGAREIYWATVQNGGEIRTLELWYSSSRCIWGVETGGQSGDILLASSHFGTSRVVSRGSSVTTGEVNDAGVAGHVCLQPYFVSSRAYGPLVCTQTW
jgi:hypothetical protein